ncbi:MAG: 7-cyano-7-deazaguanine synthase QueC [Thermosulfidibacteraceae bacterium]
MKIIDFNNSIRNGIINGGCLVKIVALLSGGMDSTTALYWAKKKYENVIAITFDYGQKNSKEIEFAKWHADKLKIEHRIIKFNLKEMVRSALLNEDIPIPKEEERGRIPQTYVPFRNGIFLAIAGGIAEDVGADAIVGGWNQVDYSGYPDCRREFLDAMERAINLGTIREGSDSYIRIESPLINMKKSEIIKLGLSLGVDYKHTLSCYEGKVPPCGECPSCRLRKKAWEELGIDDPIFK